MTHKSALLSLPNSTLKRKSFLPLYKPAQPSWLMILLKLWNMLLFGPSLLATCILLLTVMYGYVMLVAASFPSAPKKKASLGMTLRLFSTTSFNCSKIVYCRIGLMTNTSAGMTPANRDDAPSSRRSDSKVASVEGLFFGFSTPGRHSSSLSDFLAVMRVLTTQMGLVIRTVALPARAPAIIDSTVVNFEDARPAFRAARSNPARVHSYPIPREL